MEEDDLHRGSSGIEKGASRAENCRGPPRKGTGVSVAQVAQSWQQAGVSVLPIPANQSKRPDRSWAQYQVKAPTLREVNEWWGNGRSQYGIALICGSVSGNLEMTELEGRATHGATLTEILNHCDRLGIRHVWEFLTSHNGFTEMSPTGGIHLLYRISDHPVPGNTKIARRPATAEELIERPGDTVKVLAETRGEGGYVITAPSPGGCHPSGEPWVRIAGEYGVLPFITWEERCTLHQALYDALDEMPSVLPPQQLPAALPSSPVGSSAAGALDLRPGDRWADTITFGELLSAKGWVMSHRMGEEEYWVRPGKHPRDGHSATVNYKGSGLLYVFSTAVEGLEAETSYTKFGAYAYLFHNGDMKAAASELAGRWGTPRVEIADFEPEPIPSNVSEPLDVTFTCDDVGNAMRLAYNIEGRFRYLYEEKKWYVWKDTCWKLDRSDELAQAWIACTDEMRKSQDETVRKWAAKSRSAPRLRAAIDLLRSLPGITVFAEDFDSHRHLVNLGNGVLDLQDGTLLPHDKSLMMTKLFNARYDPQAQCPEFEAFMASALPDPSIRSYVQRALGYTLLGDADQRCVFLIHGPSGTGKSTLTETMRELFGGYGTTAAASTFKTSDRGAGASPDLHGLRGKRFVSTSETSVGTLFDEDLIKRISGRDQIRSRSLYEDFTEWTPQCTLWVATNNPPKFSSDDDAIWRRVKLIPFLTVFIGDGERSDMARRTLAPERDGILNWLLAGLRDYQANGLGEPEPVRAMVADQRAQSDSVAQFVDEKITDGILTMDPSKSIRTSEIFAMYLAWSREVGERGVGRRRFFNRLQSNFPHLTHEKVGHTFWVGIGRTDGAGILGTISP